MSGAGTRPDCCHTGTRQGWRAATHGFSGVWAVTWAVLQAETAQSDTCQKLIRLLEAGAPEDSNDWPEDLRQYHLYKKALLVVDGVVMYREATDPSIPEFPDT